MTSHPLRIATAGLALCLAMAAPAFAQDIDFGDDTSQWAKDGECDDPRFIGDASAAELVDADLMHDATDCKAAFEAGTVTLAEEKSPAPAPTAPAPEPDAPAPQPTQTPPPATTAPDLDFGDDTSEWAKDGECDDPRFTGSGAAEELVEVDRLHDATDCRAAFEAGTVTLADESETTAPAIDTGALAAMADRLDFGDDTSEWAKDGECDDPDFFGADVAQEPTAENRMKDATDCRTAFLAGTASFGAASSADQQPLAFDYGSDSSRWANDGQCDDGRFTGAGMAKKLEYEDQMADATDCRTLEEQGEVSIRPVYTPQYAAGAPYDASSVEFGDNSSSYADNGECDDPRFEGPGAAITLLDSDRNADAGDCKAQFEAGRIVLRDGES